MVALIPIYLVKFETLDEGAAWVDVFCGVDVLDDEPPEWTYEVCDHEDNNDQPTYFVRVHENILSRMVRLGLIVKISFDEALNTTNVKNGHHFR